METMRVLAALVSLAAAVGASAVPLPPPPDGVEATYEYGQEFVTIGDAGNRPTYLEETPGFPYWGMGGVGYEFRMARTEVTVGQWFEFVRAYDQFFDPPRVDSAFSSLGVRWDFAGQGWYTVVPLDFPANMSWEYAARYCNWLTNGKAMTAEAFTSGAYDVSTFTYNPDGTSNFQEAHSPGARFWIPTNDEWTKSVYWDPEKDDGEGGYWYYPGSSDQLLVAGPPGAGETSASLTFAGAGPLLSFPVGAYPNTQSPWGLLDASGSLTEWTESIWGPGTRSRFTRGAGASDYSYDLWDALDWPREDFVPDVLNGVRLAAVIPSPITLFPVLALTIQTIKRTRP